MNELSGEAVHERSGEAVHKPSGVAVLELSGVAVHEFRSEVVHEISSFCRSTVKLTWIVFASSQPGVSNGCKFWWRLH